MPYSLTSEELAKLSVKVTHDFGRDGIPAKLGGDGERPYEWKDCQRVIEVESPSTSGDTVFALSNDRKMLALGAGAVVGIFNFETDELIAYLRHEDIVLHVHFDPSDRILLTCTYPEVEMVGRDEKVHIWDVDKEKGNTKARSDRAIIEEIQEAMLGTGERILLSKREADRKDAEWTDKEIKDDFSPLVKTALVPVLSQILGRHAQARSSCISLGPLVRPSFSADPWSPDGRQFLGLRQCQIQPAIEQRDGEIDEVVVMQLHRGHEEGYDKDATLEVKEKVILGGHNGPIMWASISPDGRWIGSSSLDHKVRIFNAETGMLVHTFGQGRNQSWTGAFSPDSTMIAVGNSDGRLRIWNTVKGTLKHTLMLCEEGKKTEGWIRSLAWSHDSRDLLAGGDGNAVLFDLGDSAGSKVQQQQAFRMVIPPSESFPFPPRPEVYEAHISRNGNRLGIRLANGETHVYDMDQNKKWIIVQSLEPDRRRPGCSTQMAFADDEGRMLLSGDYDGKVRVWDLSH